ncbi:MAG TPA: MFS transporter [Candidatus Dormibacteraeota bacterium]|nr:MFS transporter [Candidatus Dormibacteraeota bacterium]
MAHYDVTLSRRQLARAAVASTIGTTIEWYDTILYGILVSLYLGRQFFPARDPLTSALAGYGSLFVSFLARPLGGAIFGHFGDRVGRKATLVATLLMAGLSSAGVGLLPTYAQVGVLAPALLVALRVLLGLSLGGEWGGSVLLTLEWGNRARRGFWSAWPQIGAPAASALSYALFQLSALAFGRSSTWAWRAPFLFGLVLVGVGLYLRLGVLDTPTFSRLLETRRTERRPVLAVLRRSPGPVLLSCLAAMGQQAPQVVFGTFAAVYAGTVLRYPAGTVSLFLVAAGVVGALATPLGGLVSDLAGRRRTFVAGVTAMLVYSFVYWRLLDTRVVALFLLASLLATLIGAAVTGPQAAFVAENFTGRLRYSGTALGVGLGAIVAGGPAPIVATALLQRFHDSTPIALYLAGCCLVSLVAALLLPDRSRQDLAVEYDEGAEPGLARAGA